MTVDTSRELVDRVLRGLALPNVLPTALLLLWHDGFHAGVERMRPRLERAEADADRFYYLAFNDSQARKEHEAGLRLFDIALARATTAERWAALDRIAAEHAKEASAA